MKKLISLLLVLSLLCCSILTAVGETTAPVITVDEFKSAMEKLAKEFINWDMEWTSEDNFVIGNCGSNPFLVTDNGYVTLAMVTFNVAAHDDMEIIANLFIIVSALTAACPAVRDGVPAIEAPDLVFGDLMALHTSLSVEEPTVVGTLYNTTATIFVSEEDDGSITITLKLSYTAPNAEGAPESTDFAERYVVIIAESGKIRSEASLSGGLIRTAYKGETFNLIRSSGDWYVIRVDGRTGYLHSGVAEIR